MSKQDKEKLRKDEEIEIGNISSIERRLNIISENSFSEKYEES